MISKVLRVFSKHSSFLDYHGTVLAIVHVTDMHHYHYSEIRQYSPEALLDIELEQIRDDIDGA